MPVTAFGDLKLVVSADLGELGQREGPAIPLRWNPLHSLIGWLPWGVLLALALLPPNRTLKLVYIVLVLAAELAVLAFVPEQYGFVQTAFETLALSIAAIWLVAPVLTHCPRWLVFAPLVLLVALVSVLQGLVYGDPLARGLAIESMGRLAIILGVTLSLVLTCSLSLSVVCCRKRVSLPRLGMWLVVWLVVSSAVSVLILSGSGPGLLLEDCSRLGVPLTEPGGGAIWGWAVACAVALPLVLLAPYALLSLVNPFYRERFFAMFNLRPPARMLTPSQPA